MKILEIAYHFDEYLYELLRGLRNLGSETMLILVSNREVPEDFRDLNILSLAKPRIRDVSGNSSVLRRIESEVRRYRPNVIHHQGCTPWFDLLLPDLFRHYRIVHTVHDVRPHPGERTSWEIVSQRYMRRRAHELIVHGQGLKQSLLDTHRWIRPSQVHVIPHGPLSTYARLDARKYPERRNQLLFFGRIVKYKGLEWLIKAEPLIAMQVADLKIVIAGAGESLERYRRLMTDRRRYDIINRYIPEGEVGRLFQESSLVVLPYIEASQSGVIPIAYSFKKPVVATRVGAIPEVIDDGQTGLIVEPRNARELADAVVVLLKDRTVRHRMGENGYRKLSNELSWERIAAKTMSVYRAATAAR